jgi:cytochrome P450
MSATSTATDATPEQLLAALPTPAGIAHPYPLYARLRPYAPLYGYRDYPPGTVPGADTAITAWVLLDYADVAAAARDHETYSSRDPLQENSSAPTLMMVNHDDPEHERLRRIVAASFTPRRVQAVAPWLRGMVDTLLAELPSGEVEAVGTLTSLIPARVMLRFLGCPDEDAARFRRWATAFMLSADLTPAEREASNAELFGYFVARVGATVAALARGEEVADTLLRSLLTAEVDGERLSEHEVVRFCVTLVVAGAETTTFLLTNLLHHLATMPDLRARLVREPALRPRFIDESLRHSGPPQRLFRVATRDVELKGRRIRAGDWVALFFAAANHDPQVFPVPERFDIDRPNLGQQLSFGHGIHRCLGFALARLEAEVLVDSVLARCPHLALGARPPQPQVASLLTCSLDRLWLRFAA